MTSRRSGRARLRWRAAALTAVLSVALSGCYTQMARDHQAASPDTRPYYCNAVGDGTPPGGHGNGNHVHPIYEGTTKGPLAWEDCNRLSNQFDAMLGAVQRLATAADAEAAGWRNRAGYITGLGTHHSTELIPGTTPKPFEPTKPDFLIYDGPGPDARLAGVGYAAPGNANPPEGFAGANDWWHLHKKVCVGSTGILAGGEEIADEECTALGGRQFTLPSGGTWLLHVWVQPNFQLRFDVFASGHPCLGPSGPLPRPDACWEIADHNPADGPLPGTDPDPHDPHGGHDGHGGHGGHGQ